MASSMRVHPALRRKAYLYQEYFRQSFRIDQEKIKTILPLTEITRYLGEVKIPTPDLHDLRALQNRCQKKKRRWFR